MQPESGKLSGNYQPFATRRNVLQTCGDKSRDLDPPDRLHRLVNAPDDKPGNTLFDDFRD
jgi:hypothetical protein